MKENTRLRSSGPLKLSDKKSSVIFSYICFLSPLETGHQTWQVMCHKEILGEKKNKKTQNQTWSNLPNNFLMSIIHFVVKNSYFSTKSPTSKSQYTISPEKKNHTTVLGKLDSMKYLTCRTSDFGFVLWVLVIFFSAFSKND